MKEEGDKNKKWRYLIASSRDTWDWLIDLIIETIIRARAFVVSRQRNETR